MEINKYSKAKIYFLFNNTTHEIFYIGSTIQKLCDRYDGHRTRSFNFDDIQHFNSLVSNYIRFNYNNFSIELIENYPCNNKQELLFR